MSTELTTDEKIELAIELERESFLREIKEVSALFKTECSFSYGIQEACRELEYRLKGE